MFSSWFPKQKSFLGKIMVSFLKNFVSDVSEQPGSFYRLCQMVADKVSPKGRTALQIMSDVRLENEVNQIK